MSDPKRWLNDPHAAHEIASLLKALPVPRAPTAEEHAELTRRLMTTASPPPALGITSPLVGVVLTALVAAAAWWALSSSQSEPERRPTTSLATPPPPTVVSPSPLPDVMPPVVTESAPPAASSAPPQPPTTFDTLAEEAQLLEDARRALGAAPESALALLSQHQKRFPNGQLAVERLFLTVRALERAGDRGGASRQAELLIQRFPRSIYATQLRRRFGNSHDEK